MARHTATLVERLPALESITGCKQGRINPDAMATKLRFDPAGLLNPGKLRGWNLREQIMPDAASGMVSLATLPRF